MRFRLILAVIALFALFVPAPANANSTGETGPTHNNNCQANSGIKTYNSVGHYHGPGQFDFSNFAYNDTKSYTGSCAAQWNYIDHEAAYFWSDALDATPDALCMFFDRAGWWSSHDYTELPGWAFGTTDCPWDNWYATSSNHYLSIDGVNLFQTSIGVTSGWKDLNNG